MSIYSGGDKQRRDAGFAYGAAAVESNIAADREQRRNFLQDIRQARIAQAYNEWAASSSDEYVTTSGTSAATGNIFSNFSGAYRYAVDQSNSAQRIQNLQMIGSKLEKRAEKRDKRAATATQITMAVAALAGGALGAGLLGAGGAIAGGGTVGGGIGMALGGAVGAGAINSGALGKAGRVAKSTSKKAAADYAITGLTMSLGGAMSAADAAKTGTTLADGVTSVGGTSEFSYNAATRTGVSTSWISPVKTTSSSILSTYRAATPILSVYRNTRGRQY